MRRVETEDPTGVRLCLAGDVMTGRGIDQILEHPGDPTLHEPWVSSASTYVELAERRSGALPRRVDPSYVWGEILAVLSELDPDALIVNLETAVSDVGDPWPGKGIHYRMHPANVGCLAAPGIDVAVLANNHVMDWSIVGLLRTLDVLRGAGIRTVGAGRDADGAWAPVTVEVPGGRVLVMAGCVTSSGVMSSWAATPAHPGVALLPDLGDDTADQVSSLVERHRAPGDVVVFSIHWGGNWGYEIPRAHRRFARALIRRGGVDVVHGHSSHHPLGVEVCDERLIVYGCGDLLTDYEGIRAHEEYRGGLGGLFVPTRDRETGRLLRLEIVPTRVDRFRLVRPDRDEVRWLAGVLDRESRGFGTRVRLGENGVLVAER